jgi:hypothetical protein
MLHKEDVIRTHPDARIGMTAYSVDGEKLGVIQRVDEDNITIEKGGFFRKDFVVPDDNIMDVRGDQITIRQTREELEGGRADSEDREFGFAHDEGGLSDYERQREEMSGHERPTEEARIPVRAEDLEVRREDVKVETSKPSEDRR